MDPDADLGGTKTHGSYGSESETLVLTYMTYPAFGTIFSFTGDR
jgi:hypothetical protein